MHLECALGARSVAAPLAECEDELVRTLILGPEVAEQGIEVACGFDPLLACACFQGRARIERMWHEFWIFCVVCSLSVCGFGC